MISVRPYPARPATEIYWPVPDLPADARDDEAELKSLQQFVDRVASETGETVPGTSLVAEKGDPAEALIRASRDADPRSSAPAGAAASPGSCLGR